MTITYMALSNVGGDNANPEGLIRMVRNAASLSPEYYDRYARRWIFEPGLVTYTHNGEVGGEEITEGEARKIIRMWRSWV